MGERPMPTRIDAHIFLLGEMSFDKFLVLPNRFAKLLETNFSYFAKLVAKLLEMLLQF
jgi:hypothetical protein